MLKGTSPKSRIQQLPRSHHASGYQSGQRPHSTHPPSTSAATTACGRACGGREDGVIEENTRETSNDTVSTIENSDIEGDTVNTQQTAATEPSQATDTEPLSHAERLRLRLRVALFKVQTDQTNVPMSQLRIPSRGPLGEARPHKDTSQPALLPAPVLKPTIHPTRTVTSSQKFSSPPASTEAVCRTPAMPRQRVPSPQHLSRPPNGQGGGSSGAGADLNRLSSSAVKGYAARSLLGLREKR
ncbi:MAG: hypothetical protein Q9211_005345 [Gyalolechia sp. 1 TL-2023]